MQRICASEKGVKEDRTARCTAELSQFETLSHTQTDANNCYINASIVDSKTSEETIQKLKTKLHPTCFQLAAVVQIVTEPKYVFFFFFLILICTFGSKI